MNLTLNIVLIFSFLTLFSCSVKKNHSDSSMSAKYTLAIFNDINNPSSFDESTLGDIPKSVNLKEFMTPVKDQDNRGTCSHFTAAALVESAIKKKMNVEVNLSEEYFNYSSKQNGYFSQTQAGTALTNLYTSIIDKKDFLLERDWPYQPLWFGTAEKCNSSLANEESATAECYSHNAPPAGIMAKAISSKDFELLLMKNGSTNDIITELAINKRPMSIAIPVNGRGWKNNGEVEYSEEMRSECIQSPSICGGHEVVLTGYDLDKKIFFFKNSWGKLWGQEGYGTFPIEMIDRHAKHSSVMVELKNPLVLAEDHSEIPASLEIFELSSKVFDDNSVKITTTALVKNIGFNTVKIDSTLIMKALGAEEEIADHNAELVTLNLEDYAKFETETITKGHVFLPTTIVDNFVLNEDSNAVFDISSELMSTNTVMDFVHDLRQLYFRTTLYMYSDDGGYKVLKRYYHKGNYKTI